MPQSFANMVGWSRHLIQEVLAAGDFAVDLTAGNGYDTLMLAQSVGATGRVLAFDLQDQALARSAERLRQHGFRVNCLTEPLSPTAAGISLVHGCHSEVAAWCPLSPRVVVANLGYLPGGDKRVVTKPETTLAALSASVGLLAPGGRIAVVTYSAHPGGGCETEIVDNFFSGLDQTQFEALRIQVANRMHAPILHTAEKLSAFKD